MDSSYFKVKSTCQYAFSSQKVELDFLTKLLEVVPDSYYKKGDLFTSPSTKLVNKRFQHLWSLNSKEIISTEEDISAHIDYFKSLFFKKVKEIEQLKSNIEIDISFWIWIESENSGIGFDIVDTDLDFIKRISKRLNVSFVGNMGKLG